MKSGRLPRAASAEAATFQPSLFPELASPPKVHPAIRLTEGNVARTVPPRRAGVYFLKTMLPRGGVREWVGRDDEDLRARLLVHAASATDSVLFGWAEAADAVEAFIFECLLWHAKGGAWGRLDSSGHPAPPADRPWVRCAECGQ